MKKILITDPLSEHGLEKLRKAEGIETIYRPELSHTALLEIIPEVDALIVRSQTQVTAEVIRAGRRLKVIGRAGVGVDNIDLTAATQQGIIVVNAPDGNTISAAEHTFALMISLARQIPQANYSLTQGKWERKSFMGVELRGKNLGIIGLGRIGTELAKRAKAFQMKIYAYDPYLSAERAEKLGITSVSFDDLIRIADFITIHTPLTNETRHMIDQQVLEKMKPSARIINCARGGLIDEEALYQALTEGRIAGAALDVFETEPPGEHPLFQLPQVIATPHLGASTKEAQENVALDVSEEVLHILRGQPFKNAVNLPSIPADLVERLRPYQMLAEQLGLFAVQALSQAITKVKITYSGELYNLETSPLTRMVLKGILSTQLSSVNYVNAPYLAQERGIKVTEEKILGTRGFTNLITVEVTSHEVSCTVSGTTLNGMGPRIVNIDKYPIDVVPGGHLILIHHYDRPGAIGKVGTLLGAHGINIATMQVGRQDIGGDAIMMLTIDKPIPKPVLEEIQQIEGIMKAKEIDLTLR